MGRDRQPGWFDRGRRQLRLRRGRPSVADEAEGALVERDLSPYLDVLKPPESLDARARAIREDMVRVTTASSRAPELPSADFPGWVALPWPATLVAEEAFVGGAEHLRVDVVDEGYDEAIVVLRRWEQGTHESPAIISMDAEQTAYVMAALGRALQVPRRADMDNP